MQVISPSTEYAASRDALQRVATHVVARARSQATGRFGLRAAPGGFSTPPIDAELTVVRTSGANLLVDRAGPSETSSRSTLMDGATLRELAGFVGVDLERPFTAGHDAPPLGNPDEPLVVDPVFASAAGAWLGFGATILDAVVHDLGPSAAATVMQLWPEHFDLGGSVQVGEQRVNVGAALGDSFHELPYLYVAPWDDRRPGPATQWNAPFGAALRHEELVVAPDAERVARRWFAQVLGSLET
jgi:hypothetical protein